MINLQTSEKVEEEKEVGEGESCKLMRQTQTLQIGCQDEQQYSLRTKLCYPNNQFSKSNRSPSPSTAYTQLESEINLHVLGYWIYEDNFVVISRSMSNEILCSVSSLNSLHFAFG